MDIKQAIALVTVAFILYIVGLIQSRKYEYVAAETFFGVGLAIDCWGSWSMYQNTGTISFNWHTVIGAISLLFMLLLVIMGGLGLLRYSTRILNGFRQFAPYACAVWALNFFSGALSH
jgi:hypothetical protein